ncbi:MAG: hypothetical protein ABIW76_17840 [Fibrobacteria bacterium]
MKTMHSKLITALAGAILIGVSSASAHEGVDHSKEKAHVPETAKAASPASATPVMNTHDGMTALYARLQEIEAQLAANQLGHIHDAVEGIAAATHDLDRDTTLDATKRKRVQGYVKNVATLMEKVHDAADGKQPDAAKKAFAQLKAQVDLLDKQFAHSHKPSAGSKPAGIGSVSKPAKAMTAPAAGK